MRKEILCTLGPATFNHNSIARLSALGVSLFRINLSHTKIEDLAPLVELIRRSSEVPICLDSEGAQVRTGRLMEGVILQDNSFVRVRLDDIVGDSSEFALTPANCIEQLKVGDMLTIDFNACAAHVVAVDQNGATLRVLSGGLVGTNKAVSVQREIELPPLSPKDLAAVALGRQMGLRHFALSFASSAHDVTALRMLTGPDAVLIAKVESRRGVANLDEIALAADAILIDRGDLSRQVPIERIPSAQKHIISRTKALGRKCYVATNLAESMITSPSPTRAEVSDIWNTLADGADGLVLAAETAIGSYPVQCVAVVKRIAEEFLDDGPFDLERPAGGALPAPHGGLLIERWASSSVCVDALPSLQVSERELLDAEQLALGYYAPLTGFMGREDLTSVLDTNRLASGLVWTLPIVLRIPHSANFTNGSTIALRSDRGVAYALLHISERYQFSTKILAELWFGTSSYQHPGVRRLLQQEGDFLAGEIELIKRVPSRCSAFSMTPLQTRFTFQQRGWRRVVAFHTRNVIHRAHEHIQLEALRRSLADGLLLNPLVGPSEAGDFRAEAVIASYSACLEAGIYPANQALLAAWPSWPRYAGPRESVFTALVRKNLGCSHIIIGRDHSGVGGFYAPDDYDALFDSVGDLGINPVRFDEVGYDPDADCYVEGAGVGLKSISGTRMRGALRDGDLLPDWLMRPQVASALAALRARGEALFVE